jgi:hypothetical protein
MVIPVDLETQSPAPPLLTILRWVLDSQLLATTHADLAIVQGKHVAHAQRVSKIDQALECTLNAVVVVEVSLRQQFVPAQVVGAGLADSNALS